MYDSSNDQNMLFLDTKVKNIVMVHCIVYIPDGQLGKAYNKRFEGCGFDSHLRVICPRPAPT